MALRIQPLHAHKVLDAKITDRRDADLVQLWGWKHVDNDNQRWRADDDRDLPTRITCVATGLVLDVDGGRLFPLEHVVLKHATDGRPTQLWHLDEVGGGAIRIRSAASPPGETIVIDVLASSARDGAPLGVFRWHGGNNQRFHFSST